MSGETQFNEELMCYVVGNRILSVRAVKLIVFASVCFYVVQVHTGRSVRPLLWCSRQSYSVFWLFFFSGECAAPDKHEVISWDIQMRSFIIFNFRKILFNDDIMIPACITHRWRLKIELSRHIWGQILLERTTEWTMLSCEGNKKKYLKWNWCQCVEGIVRE